MICCTNKCIVNERYIPEHQNKLNIYDLQNYEFFFNRKKIRKIRYILRMKKIRKIRILDLWFPRFRIYITRYRRTCTQNVVTTSKFSKQFADILCILGCLWSCFAKREQMRFSLDVNFSPPLSLVGLCISLHYRYGVRTVPGGEGGSIFRLFSRPCVCDCRLKLLTRCLANGLWKFHSFSAASDKDELIIF